MMNYSKEAMAALAEYIEAFDKCANEPDENYGKTFTAMERQRKNLTRFFNTEEFNTVIINLDKIRKILREAGLITK
jgi:hypothetical protein